LTVLNGVRVWHSQRQFSHIILITSELPYWH
jgi:hypothetical protein